MRILLHVFGMFLLGAASLIGVGLLYHTRVEPRIAVRGLQSELTPVGTSGTAGRPASSPGASAIAGMSTDLDLFVRTLAGGSRSEAMRALDGAYHVADVLQSASPHEPATTTLFDRVNRIRRDVQNGRDAVAIAAARDASVALLDTELSIAGQPPRSLAPYIGATVISPTGDMLGTIRSVAADEVVVESGGVRQLLGFIDIRPGTLTTMPADRLLFGAIRRFGTTMILASGGEHDN